MYRHHPQWQRAQEMVDEGKIGDLRTIQTFFSYFNANPEDIRKVIDALNESAEKGTWV